MKRLFTLSWALFTSCLVLFMTSPAFACPYCAGRERDDVSTAMVVGAFVMLPFVIVPVAAYFIRRAEADNPFTGQAGGEMTSLANHNEV